MEPVRCRRCLLSELDPEGVYATVRDYIASLDESVKADESEYRRRLDKCRTCGHLMNGMCALCGCFVEARAAKSGSSCPDLPARW